jgi:hypothetical protein
MRISLHYRGRLNANGSPSHKHDIRLRFHQQLQTLWQQFPLNEFNHWLTYKEDPNEYSVLRTLDKYTFAPLVTGKMNGIVELSIVLLRPEKPGGLITQGGDIDNRLKTLFDALTMPRHGNALPKDLDPATEPNPFFCLLEDDNLVTSLQVRTEQLLEPDVHPCEVDLTIHVRTRVTAMTVGNWPLV